METHSGAGAPSTSGADFAPVPLQFSGSGEEYFGIWIVNLLLTIVTLGIYSAWAKVRRLQYFYRHTSLASSSFDFHGSPTRILIGRLIALAMLIAYNVSTRWQSRMTLVVLLAFALILPWLLRNSLRFRLYNTSWRGTRFHFKGSVAGSYRVFLLNGFLTLITLYVMAPFMHQRLKAYQHNNTWLGRMRCSFHARAGQFYLIYLLIVAVMAVVVVAMVFAGVTHSVVSVLQMQRQGHRINPRAVLSLLLIVYGTLIAVALLIGPVFHALITNLIWNNTRLGEHRIQCSLSALPLIWITFSNFVLVLVTIGLFTPWARVRLARYQLQCMQLLPVSDLQEFVDSEPEALGAVGEEAATAFDFDISL